MTKKTHIKVGGVWKPCTDVWIKVGGIWKQNVMPHLKVSGVHKECMNYVTDVELGQLAYGGVVIYILQPGDPGYDANVQHGLIAATTDAVSSASWGCQGTLIGTSYALGEGANNTALIIAGCGTAGIAARRANDFSANGYTDWFLPSNNELQKLYDNRDYYGYTIATLYWSSSEYSTTRARGLRNTGTWTNDWKGSPANGAIAVKPFRKF